MVYYHIVNELKTFRCVVEGCERIQKSWYFPACMTIDVETYHLCSVAVVRHSWSSEFGCLTRFVPQAQNYDVNFGGALPIASDSLSHLANLFPPNLIDLITNNPSGTMPFLGTLAPGFAKLCF